MCAGHTGGARAAEHVGGGGSGGRGGVGGEGASARGQGGAGRGERRHVQQHARRPDT